MPMKALADAVLILHAAYVGFVVGGFLLTLAGLRLGWRWVRNRWFRGLHLAAILYVVVQGWLGIQCPLTTLENALRRRAGQEAYSESFIQDWLHRILFFQADSWVFTTVYTVFGAAVLATWWLARPGSRGTAAGSSR